MAQRSEPRFRLVVQTSEENEPILCCPFCGSSHVRPAHVVVDVGVRRTRVTAKATRVEASRANAGAVIELSFWAECGHRFAYRWMFHRGKFRGELSALPSGNMGPEDEMWFN